jgi:TOD1/MUCI70, glycosyltransferase-like domain
MLEPGTSCIYTCLIGRYEKLNEQPMARASALPFVCLTDDPDLVSETWRIVRVQPAFQCDPVRSQRLLKLLPHRYLDGFTRSLYIDNSVVLTAPAEKILAEYLTGVPFALPTHSYRERARDEFTAVLAHRFDDPVRVAEQRDAYEACDPDGLDERPFWTAILLRDHCDPAVRAALETWAMHVLRYSRRDQLSANHAFRHARFSPRRIEIDNHASWFHNWPVVPEGRARRGWFTPESPN